VSAPRLRYLPLGGLGEVGINMWALEWEKQILVVDAGLMFPHEDMLGIDLVLPDISYLLDRSKDVLGIFLSHGHEDHIGGLPYVLKKLNVPVYGTRLTLGLVKPKLKEHRILREADLREVRVGDAVQSLWRSRRRSAGWSTPATSSLMTRPPTACRPTWRASDSSAMQVCCSCSATRPMLSAWDIPALNAIFMSLSSGSSARPREESWSPTSRPTFIASSTWSG
jgi:hypothetical protein